MSKKNLIDTITQAINDRKVESPKLTKTDAEAVLDQLACHATAELAAGRTVEIPGLLRLKVVERSERAGRNPQTGAPITLLAKRVVKASAVKALADAVWPAVPAP
jgi:DNA-binding protein HU-beta